MGASGGGVSGRARSSGRGTGESPGGPHTPSGIPFGRWLDRRIRGGRLGKDRSGPAVSSACYEALDEIRRELGEQRGYSSREISYGNLVEVAVDLLREHVFQREGAECPDDTPPSGRRGRP